ncbi:hypothetical protein A1D22_00975 [Pasteurellaceae bacterium LFhippo2]|nr:hypothetical protein [Pasteurellaceae bacterium LFhippo2]
MRVKSYSYLILILSLFSSSIWAVNLPNEKELQAQIEATQKLEQTEETKSLLQSLTDTQKFLSQISQQKSDSSALEKQIQDSKTAINESKEKLAKLKAQQPSTLEEFSKKPLTELQSLATNLQAKLEQVQHDLAQLNAQVVAQNSTPTKAQTALSTIATRKQQITNALGNSKLSSADKVKFDVENSLLDLQHSYNQTLLNGSDSLLALFSSQLDEKKVVQQNLQTELANVQTAINNHLVAESKNKAEQATQSQQESSKTTTNPVILHEIDLNTELSKDLFVQTTELSQLSQDNLRVKGILDNLQQTQRNIDEQISSLQGTLVLSRIINKHRQLLPQDKMVKGLSKQIADLRVQVFDLSELKDTISDSNAYVTKLEKENKATFTDKEKEQLTTIIQERSTTLSDLIKLLNNQLNLSINIELNQQQVEMISDELQQKLQQQSFWVKSNNPIDLDWLTKYPQAVQFQLKELSKKFDFSNWQENIGVALFLIALLSGIGYLINRSKESIKHKLTNINNRMKTVLTDSQWHTPTAMFWTVVLCLPNTIMFLTCFIFITYICFQDPLAVWPWGLKMAGYWLYFVFIISMLRPAGIAYRHFSMPQESNQIFRNMLKRSGIVIALLLNTSIFSNIEMGLAYDVIGQTVTITVLMMTVFIVAPGFRQAISTYQNVSDKDKKSHNILLNLVRIVLLLAPIVLIALIVMGYYYTALVLIEHLIATYFAVITWIIIRNMLYRMFTVSSRRIAYKRLQERRAQQNAEQRAVAFEDDVALELPDDSIAVSEIKDQMLKVTDFLLWVGLFALIYWVWSDLITVAYYLNGVTLWQQATTTETGVVMESITLLNLLIAIVILVVTYVLVRNLSGLLETLIFSKLQLSQGTPYTVTTLLTYVLIVVGASFAFSTLGMSWTKLQWLFTALSVGIGFGMQEIVANFVSGIIILFERPVRVGDMITIGNFSGTVSKIRIRATTLIDGDKKEVIVPNKAFITERIVNWALTNSVTRLVISVGVAYGSDLEKVRALLHQAAEENELVLKDPAPSVFFLSFGASTLDHELRVFVGQLSDRMKTTDALNRRINELFAENNIEIAFNQLDVFIKNQDTQEEVKLATDKFVK